MLYYHKESNILKKYSEILKNTSEECCLDQTSEKQLARVFTFKSTS